MQHTPFQIPQWKDPQPHFCTESLSEGRDFGPIIHKCHHIYPLYHNHSLIDMAKYLYQGVRFVIHGFCHWFVGTYQCPWLPFFWLCTLGDRLEAFTTFPQFPFKGMLRHCWALWLNPHIKDNWSHCSHIPHNCFHCCLGPLYYVNFYYHSLHLLTVEGCWLWFPVSPTPALPDVWLALSDSQCCPSPLTELISLRLPPWVSPFALTQPYGLLSWVEGTLSSGHHTSSTWNHATACKANERGDPLSVFEPHLHSASLGVPAELHLGPPLIGLHILSCPLFSLVVSYKNFALNYWWMSQCHIQVLIYLLSLTLGLEDLDIKPGQPWLHVRTILFPCSMSPLCDFPSHSSHQMPFVQMRPLPYRWSLH